MKHFSKNFIAFTLSEMMIVLLIISVISAATLPAITSRDESQAGGISATTGASSSVYSNWLYDSTYTKGYYFYKKTNNSAIKNEFVVAIGNEISTSLNLFFGGNPFVPLVLTKKTNLNYSGLFTDMSLKNFSDIVFFNSLAQNTGRIAFDYYGSLAIGKDVGLNTLDYHPQSLLGIGYKVGDKISDPEYNSYGMPKYMIGNVLIGSYAAYAGGVVYPGSIVLGSNIQNQGNLRGSIIIGGNASQNSKKSAYNYPDLSGYVGIGAYSGYANPSSNLYGVNVGYYAGARNTNTYKDDSIAMVNIGAYAGYDSSPTGYIPRDRSDPILNSNAGVVSIGYWAGSQQTAANGGNNRVTSSDGFGAVNIGYYAGNQTDRGGNINIGHYAGVNTIIPGNSSGDFIVNIGNYAGYFITGVSEKSVNVGHYAGYRSDNTYSINIGKSAGVWSTQNRVTSIGTYAGYANKASHSVFIGKYAGAYVEGDNNVIIASISDERPSSSATRKLSNNVIIGCDMKGSFDNKFCIGGDLNGRQAVTNEGRDKNIWTPNNYMDSPYKRQMLFVPGNGVKAASNIGFGSTMILLYATYVVSPNTTMYKFSDRRLKENIKPTKYGIDKLRNIIIYQYNMIGRPEPCIGVVAQQLMKFYPNAVEKAPDLVKKGGYLTVDSDWIVYSLAQAIKDVDKMTENLSKMLTEQTSKLTKLSQSVDNIEVRLDRISKSNQETQKQLKEMESITKKWSGK